MSYRIKDWPTHFENNRTKELVKMTWVPIPNKQDGDGYTELLDHPAGASHLGAWLAIVQVASKCEPRGTLLRDGGKPHDASTLSRMSRIPVEVLVSAIDRLLLIGWMEQMIEEMPIKEHITHIDATVPHEGAVKPHDDAPSRARAGARAGREGKGREGNYSAAGAAKTPDEKPTRKRREPDVLWDAVAAAWFGGNVAEPHQKRCGKIVRELRQLEATPEKLAAVRTAYRKAWPNMIETPDAIVKHWCEFIPKPTPPPDPDAAYSRYRATGDCDPKDLAEFEARAERDLRGAA